MASIVNRASVATATTGTGTVTLGSAASGFQSLAAAGVANGDWLEYLIEDGTAWEIGLGQYSSTGPTMTRTLNSSSSGSLLNLSGSAVVSLTLTAGMANIGLAALFGTGSDGSLTVSSGTTTLTRDMHYQNLTITGGSLVPNGNRVFVAGVLDLTAAPAGAILSSGNNGTSATSTTGGAGALNTGTLPISTSVSDGGNPGGSGATGAAAATSGKSAQILLGGGGGGGGLGGSGSSASSNAAGFISAPYKTLVASPVAGSLRVGQILSATLTALFSGIGGTGGTGGSGDGTNAGGGGGGGGGSPLGLEIYARFLNRGASSAVGAISAKGGNGGNGFTQSTGNVGGGGGGGAAGGGSVVLVIGSLLGSAATNLVDASGGNGGNGGNGVGTGNGGRGGQGGGPGRLDLFVLSTGTFTPSAQVGNPTGNTASIVSTPTGGSGTAGNSRQVTV